MSDELIAIVSDIHGNETAFRTALDYLRELAVEKIVCLGDVVGYGQGARACVELIRSHNIPCIQGNHDAQVRPPRDPRTREEAIVALEHAERTLSTEQIDWLDNLPTQQVFENQLLLVHGAITGRDDYILTREALQANAELLANDYKSINLCFFGHTHLPMVVGGDTLRTKFPNSDIVELAPHTDYMINPGSIGQPRDGVPKTSFVVYDRAAAELTFVRLDYDIATEQERMRAAEFPERLIERLALGK